jgi:threonine dehydratase
MSKLGDEQIAVLTQGKHMLPLEQILEADQRLRRILRPTPLQENLHLSQLFDCELMLKREDLQVVRSYKIRGAYNKMASFEEAARKQGVICASAGNHAQGVAYSCQKMQVQGKIFMPATTPRQKVDKVILFGKEFVEIELVGDTFDDAYQAAREEADQSGALFIHPFDDPAIIAGQATVGKETLEQTASPIDYVFVPIGGGGLASGLGSYFKHLSPNTKIIGVEPAGAPAMQLSLEKGKRSKLEHIDKFVDGAAVREVGKYTFEICKEVLDEVVTVPEGQVCSTILQLYNEEAIVVEPAGALAVTALHQFKEEIKGKHVVCVLSGSNNDITRTEEIKERSLLFEGLKHYFIVRFPQRAGALREFLTDVLGPNDDITRFEYTKRTNRDTGPALVGIEVTQQADLDALIARLEAKGFPFQLLNEDPDLFQLLV